MERTVKKVVSRLTPGLRCTDADNSGGQRQEKVVSARSIPLHFHNEPGHHVSILSQWKRPVKAPVSLSALPLLQLHVSKVTGSRGYWEDFP